MEAKFTHTHTYVTHLITTQGAVGSSPRLREGPLHNGNLFMDHFFTKRKYLLISESSRTLIVLFLTFSPFLMCRSGMLAQFGHVLACFSIRLVIFSSYSFDVGAKICKICPSLFSEKGFLTRGNFSPETWHFPPYGKKASCSCD